MPCHGQRRIFRGGWLLNDGSIHTVVQLPAEQHSSQRLGLAFQVVETVLPKPFAERLATIRTVFVSQRLTPDNGSEVCAGDQS